MRGFDPREPGAFAVVVLVGFVVAKFLSVAAHEVLGHGLFTQLVGGVFYGVYVSPGSGFSLIYVPPTTPAAASALVDLSGILVNVLLGVAVFAAYPRVRTFLGRLFALLLLQTFLVYSVLYLALGAVEGTAGDPALAVADLRASFLTASFLLVGLLWALGISYAISMEVARLGAPGAPLRRQLAYLALFWFAPIIVGVAPGLVTASGPLLVYFLLFLGIGGAILAGVIVLASRIGPSRRAGVERPVGRLAPLVVAFAVVVPAWVGGFGLTDSTAHGVLLAEPPLAVESRLTSSLAIDARIDLSADRNVSLAFLMRGIELANNSPLESAVFHSFDDRADIPSWAAQAALLAGGMMNVSTWTVDRVFIDSNGTVWSGGGTVGHPRVAALVIRYPEDKPFLTDVTVNGTRTFLSLTVFDPFRARRLPMPCDGCYLDEVNLTWPSGSPEPYGFVSATAVGGTPDRFVGYDAATSRHFARFRNLAASDAPTTYVLALEVF